MAGWPTYQKTYLLDTLLEDHTTFATQVGSATFSLSLNLLAGYVAHLSLLCIRELASPLPTQVRFMYRVSASTLD
jgi:hypothetical protein